MSEWLNEFTNWLRERDKSERTVNSYQAAVRIFSEWHQCCYDGRPFAPSDLTARDVLAYRDELQSIRGLGASTINVALSALHSLAKWCIDTGRLRDDPLSNIKFIALQEPGPKWMKKGELRKLLAEFERNIHDARARGATQRVRQAVRDMAAIALMCGAGLRINEVVCLTVADLELTERKAKVLVRFGKGRKQRTVPLTDAREPVVQWLELRGAQPGPLFDSQKGERITVRQLQRGFAEKARRAGVQGYTPHSLRHTFLKRIFDVTGNLGVAQRLAGHAHIASTARYVIPSEEELRTAMAGVML